MNPSSFEHIVRIQFNALMIEETKNSIERKELNQ